MKNILICLITIIVCCLYLENAFGDDRDLSREKKWYRNYSGDGSTSVSSFCMEDHVFVMVSGDNNNALSIIQVYEERGGKVVPKKCY